ncbi:DsbA family protein [Kistimonas asteriae]|uniref:DsbA family protein n=1 Tax=Kistimonas asteriae TaxID=517724 RepID=UPI001BA72E08|nr:DsbA family protein [Kistimonas asteriae]
MKQWLKVIASFFLSSLVLMAGTVTAQVNPAEATVQINMSDNLETGDSLNHWMKARRLMEQRAIKAHHQALFENPHDPFQGKQGGQLTIAYFFDYNCAFCKRQDAILQEITRQFPQVRVVYKDMPILTASSFEAAELALAVYRQTPEQYSDFHRRLMAKPGAHTHRSIQATLDAEGLDPKALKKAMGPDVTMHLYQNLGLAEALGIGGTPSLVFPDQIVVGFKDEQALTNLIRTHLQGQARHEKTSE